MPVDRLDIQARATGAHSTRAGPPGRAGLVVQIFAFSRAFGPPELHQIRTRMGPKAGGDRLIRFALPARRQSGGATARRRGPAGRPAAGLVYWRRRLTGATRAPGRPT